jgi:DNA-binding transcriptional regulator YiaG
LTIAGACSEIRRGILAELRKYSGNLRAAQSCPKTLRRALSLTQEEFAAQYHIPIGTLRDWEQGRCEPDQPAQAYLSVIAHDPEGVKRALAKNILPKAG